MKCINFSFCHLFLLSVLLIPFATNAADSFPGVPAAPKLGADSYVLVDYATGMVLAEHDANKRVEPASLTKIMTSYVAADALKQGAVSLDDKTTVSEKAWRMEGSRMFIEVNKQITVDELLQGIIIQSGNDASVALAEHISGSEDVFSQVMNQHSERMAMVNSSFANSTGLPDEHTYTTAYDLSLLAAAFIRDFPDIYSRFAEDEYTYADIRQFNRNRLLARDESVDGIKTGHTESAGYCLVSSAKRGDMRLIAAVMGAESDVARTEASQTLLNYGFRFFESKLVYGTDVAVASSKVWKGSLDKVKLGVAHELFVTVPRGKYDEIEAEAEISQAVEAPVANGQTVGKLLLKLEDVVLSSVPLVAMHAVDKGSIFSRAVDEVMMRLE